jgi:hypothetical protein
MRTTQASLAKAEDRAGPGLSWIAYDDGDTGPTRDSRRGWVGVDWGARVASVVSSTGGASVSCLDARFASRRATAHVSIAAAGEPDCGLVEA